MDLLKEELRKKRQALAEESGGRKYFKRSETEQKKIQKLREEEKRELEAKSKALRQKQNPNLSSNPSSSTNTQNPNSNSDHPPSKTTPETLTQEQKIDDLVLPRQEVIRRLRFLKQPITLFGEDDDARLDRLKTTLKAGVFEVDSDMTEGQTNDFLRDIAELKKRQKTGILSDRKRKNNEGELEDGDGGGAGGEGEISGDGESSGVDTDKDLKLMKANFEDLCNEDKILVFFKKLLLEWKQELNDMTDTEKRTAKGKSMVATFKQCARYLHPLFKFCRKKVQNAQNCQICIDHIADKPCPLMYSRCKIPGCNGIRQIMEAHTAANGGRKFLKCQHSSCTGFQWLDDAIIEARGLVGSSASNKPVVHMGCFHCGGVGHWKKDCPWIGACCKMCGGVVMLKVSGKKESEGRRYLKCESCQRFEWFSPEDKPIGNVKMTLEGSLEDFCNMFQNKLSHR